MHLSAARAVVLGALLAGLAGVAGPGVTVPVAQARDDTVYECSGINADDLRVTDDAVSGPLTLMGVDRTHELLASEGKVPGGRVRVAVLDSGVSTASGLVRVAERHEVVGGELADPHGTVVAGLIAGGERPGGRATGVAPGAEIVDVRIFDQDPPGDGDVGIDPANLVAGLDWVADNAHRLRIKVANVSLAVPDDPRLRRAVRRVWKAGVLLVAASGNRPTEDTDLLFEKYGDGGSETGPGEDAAKDVYPAAYPHVLAVSATTAGLPGAEPVKSYVLANRETDVAAPTFDAVSIALNGSTCRVQQVATSFAAAEVSGVAAMLRSAFRKDDVDDTIARLEQTASGTTEDRTPFEGAGVVQPLEALTRPLHPGSAQGVDRSREEHEGGRATAPEPQADVLAATRDHAIWWGLLGGGALLLALLLRPVLARRR